MQPDEIDEILLRTWDDRRLSRSERKVLASLLAEHQHQHEVLSFFKHRAFALARRNLSGSSNQQVLDWLEEVIKAVSQAEAGEAELLAEALFSPGDRCQRRIIGLIQLARRSLDICVFTITDDRIAHEILQAHQRGVAVRIITDDEKAGDRGSDVLDLARAGIPVRMDGSEHHMHHKFGIFDQRYLLTGSYNWTRSAAAHNEENIVVSNDPRLLSAFQQTFDQLWRQFGGA